MGGTEPPCNTPFLLSAHIMQCTNLTDAQAFSTDMLNKSVTQTKAMSVNTISEGKCAAPTDTNLHTENRTGYNVK